MIARIKPLDFEWTELEWEEIAARYGLSEKEIKETWIEFLQCEGYDDGGREYQDLHQWLVRNPQIDRDPTPWQKGDDYRD